MLVFPSALGFCCHRHLVANKVVDVTSCACPSTDFTFPAADRGVDGGVVAPCSVADREVGDHVEDEHADFVEDERVDFVV